MLYGIRKVKRLPEGVPAPTKKERFARLDVDRRAMSPKGSRSSTVRMLLGEMAALGVESQVVQTRPEMVIRESTRPV